MRYSTTDFRIILAPAMAVRCGPIHTPISKNDPLIACRCKNGTRLYLKLQSSSLLFQQNFVKQLKIAALRKNPTTARKDLPLAASIIGCNRSQDSTSWPPASRASVGSAQGAGARLSGPGAVMGAGNYIAATALYRACLTPIWLATRPHQKRIHGHS